MGAVNFIIVGLGNPGREYENTRHNAGFLAVELLAKRLGVKLNKLKYKSLCGDAQIGDSRVLLMKPSTFMNNSGEAVREAAQFYKVSPEHIIILFDDVSLDVGRLRIRRQGSDGGHNGIKSILYLLGKDTFPRVKIGVGKKPHPDYDLAAWVLGKFPKADGEALESSLESAADAAVLIVEGKTEQAMNLYNS